MSAIAFPPSVLLEFIDMPAFDLHSFARLSSTQMLNCAVEGIGIALLAWTLLRVLGRQNSGTRFAVWFSALLGIASLPLIGHFTASDATMTEPSRITMPASWALYIFAGWAVIAAAGLVRIAVGFWRLRQLRKSCVRIEAGALDPLLRKTLDEFDSPRTAALCVSDRLHVPTAVGFIEPLVVIPSWTTRELSAADLNAILLHELAHLRRWDDWTNLIQKVLSALLFFHPAVWWIEKKLALEREMACDDLVLAKTESPHVYAECLVSLAEKSLLRRGLGLAQAAIGRVRHMSLRVAQILDEKRLGATRVWRPAPVLLMGSSILCLMALSDAPRLVSFEAIPTASLAAANATPGGRDVDPGAQVAAHMVPAKFVLKPEARTTVPVIAPETKTKKKTKATLGESAVVPPKTTPRRVNSPLIVLSDFKQDASAPHILIFVMQTEFVQTGRPDASGAVMWDLCVWRITVIAPAENRTEPGVVAKST